MGSPGSQMAGTWPLAVGEVGWEKKNCIQKFWERITHLRWSAKPLAFQWLVLQGHWSMASQGPRIDQCNPWKTIAKQLRWLHDHRAVIEKIKSPYQWLLETIAMASRNHCNGFPKPLQWLCETIAMEVKETTFSKSIAMALRNQQWLRKTSNGFAKPLPWPWP